MYRCLAEAEEGEGRAAMIDDAAIIIWNSEGDYQEIRADSHACPSRVQ